MSFWWEDGYDPSVSAAVQKGERSLRADANGATFLVENLKTDAHHLHGQYNPKRRQLITLDGCGKEDSRIRVRCADKGVILQEFPVHSKSGYIAVSGDGSMVAIGVLKEDYVEIYELSSGDLLLSLEGGRKTGFWGQLAFLPGSNKLLELRAIEYARGIAKRNVMRLWDLGFCNRKTSERDNHVLNAWFHTSPEVDPTEAVIIDDAGSDEDDDIEDKKWEIEMWKGINHFVYREDTAEITASSEEEKKICFFDSHTGNCNPTRNISHDKWCGHVVYSSCFSYLAVSESGFCTVRSSDTNEILSVVKLPDVPFPVTPLGFVQNDRLLILRVNLDRHIIVCDWRSPEDILLLTDAGGTTSNACAISPDQKYLACWPHGFLEYYDLSGMIEKFRDKYPRMKRITVVLARELYLQKRAMLDSNERKRAPSGGKDDVESKKQTNKYDTPYIWESICNVDKNVLRYILEYV